MQGVSGVRNDEVEEGDTTMLPELLISETPPSSMSIASTTSSDYFGSRPGSSSAQSPMSVLLEYRKANNSTSSLGLR